MYTRRDGTGSELMVAVYVDALVISGSSTALVSDFKQSLASKYDLTDQGELTQILGIKVVRDKRNKCFYLSQTSLMMRLKILGKTTDHTLWSLFKPNFMMHTDKEIKMNRRRVIGSEKQEEKPTIKVQTTREKREEVMDCSCNLIH